MTFDLRMAWLALRRTRGLTVVMVIALSLGIGTWYAQRQIFTFLDAKTPHAPPHLFHVSLDRGEPAPADARSVDVEALLPSILLSDRDAAAVAAAAPGRHVVTFGAPVVIEPVGVPAEVVRARYANRDLFAVFALPFVDGGAWTGDEAVIDEQLADRLFPNASAVGKTLRIDGDDLRIVGVVARRHADRFHLYERFVPTPDLVYLPLPRARAAETTELQHVILGDNPGGLTVWVELASEADRSALSARVAAYLTSERATRRTAAPRGMTLRSSADVAQLYAPGGTINLWPILSALCVVTCIVNLIRMLMVKFSGRRHELGLLRAFGARRRGVMLQLLVEAMAIGLVAGVLGVLLGLALMPVALGTVRGMAGSPELISIGAVVSTVGASIGAALIASIYPAWRLARGTPVHQLRGG